MYLYLQSTKKVARNLYKSEFSLTSVKQLLNTSNLQGVEQTNKTVEIVSTGRIAVTVIEVANTMGICKITATPPVLTAIVSKIHDIQQ